MGNIKYAITTHTNRSTGEIRAYGYAVRDPYVLGDLGSIYPTIKTEGVDKVDDFNTSMIKAVRVRFL